MVRICTNFITFRVWLFWISFACRVTGTSVSFLFQRKELQGINLRHWHHIQKRIFAFSLFDQKDSGNSFVLIHSSNQIVKKCVHSCMSVYGVGISSHETKVSFFFLISKISSRCICWQRYKFVKKLLSPLKSVFHSLCLQNFDWYSDRQSSLPSTEMYGYSMHYLKLCISIVLTTLIKHITWKLSKSSILSILYVFILTWKFINQNAYYWTMPCL